MKNNFEISMFNGRYQVTVYYEDGIVVLNFPSLAKAERYVETYEHFC